MGRGLIQLLKVFTKMALIGQRSKLGSPSASWTGITFSRGPMARKKQSREQLGVHKRVHTLSIIPPAAPSNLGVLTPQSVSSLAFLLYCSSLPTPAMLFDNNLFAARRHIKHIRLQSPRLWHKADLLCFVWPHTAQSLQQRPQFWQSYPLIRQKKN